MRKAYGDMFTNLSWTDVSQYLHFDLFESDLFVLGTREPSGRVAVPIMLSSLTPPTSSEDSPSQPGLAPPPAGSLARGSHQKHRGYIYI